ncbi:MAG: hypothetical protein IJY42_00115 [Clostridia bacterium]|nr:hypothetical protein [Clostridia bacterium]
MGFEFTGLDVLFNLPVSSLVLILGVALLLLAGVAVVAGIAAVIGILIWRSRKK